MSLVFAELDERSIRIEPHQLAGLQQTFLQPTRGLRREDLDRVLVETPRGVRHDTIPIDLRDPTKSFAPSTGSDGIVEGEQARTRVRKTPGTAVTDPPLAVDMSFVDPRPSETNDNLALSSTERQGHGLDQSTPLPPFVARMIALVKSEPIDQQPPGLRFRRFRSRRRLEKLDHVPRFIEQSCEAVAHEIVSNLRRAADATSNRRDEKDPLTGVVRSDPSGGRGDATCVDGGATFWTDRLADLREEMAEMIEDLGGATDRRPRTGDTVALFDRNGRRQIRNVIDLRPRKPLQKLSRVGRQRTHIAALPFGVQRVEGQRRLPRTRRARHDSEGPQWENTVDSAQIV